MFFKRETRVCLAFCFGVLLFIVGCGGGVSERAGQPKAVQQEAAEEVEGYVESEAVEEEVVEEVKERVSEEVEDGSVLEERQEPEKAVEGIQRQTNLALKFKAGDETSYKLTTQSSQGVKWEGDLPNNSQFKGGRNEKEMEMIFTQRIMKVDESGTALARIKIDKLKLLVLKNERVMMDFDSSKKHRSINALSRLPGKSYKILLSSRGEVLKVTGTGKIQEAAKHGMVASTKLAGDIVNNAAITHRHGRLGFPSAGEFELAKGQQWTDIKSFDFGRMGSEVYERVYAVDEIDDSGVGRTVSVSMEAIPSTKAPAELSNQKRGGLSDMFDNKATYVGELGFDLDSGGINHYTEDLSVQWFMIMPSKKNSNKAPTVLQMSADRKYDLEKVE